MGVIPRELLREYLYWATENDCLMPSAFSSSSFSLLGRLALCFACVIRLCLNYWCSHLARLR